MGGRRRRTIATSMLVATLVACGGGGGSNDATNGSVLTNSGTEPTADSTPAADAAEMLALAQPERDEALAALGMESELTVAASSGLEADLGGTGATRDALVAAWAPIVAEVMSLSAAADQEGFRRGAAPEPPSLGEGLFGGVVLTWLGAELAGQVGRDATPSSPIDWSNEGLTASGTPNHGEVDFEMTHENTETGVTTQLTSKITMQPCPDADGHFEGSAALDVFVSKGSVSQRAAIHVDVVGQVDDNANLASSETTGDTTWTDAAGARLGSTSGDATFESLLGHSLVEGARKAWQSGGCVRIDVTGAGTVAPGAVVDVIAAPRSKIDGAATGGTVTATFAGELSAEPMNTALDADASFVYTAPTDGLPAEGTLTFESRSRRGIGKAQAVMRVERITYVISGTGPEIVFSGTTELSLEFQATGTFTGGTATFEFNPDRDENNFALDTGTVTISGAGNGVTLDGSGTYTMTGNPDGTYTLIMQERSCVHIPGPRPQDVCKPHTNTLTLTPAA